MVWRAEGHFSEEIFKDLRILKPISSKPETKKISLPINEGTKLFSGGGWAPNKCREQTGRVQLDVDEVAHKMLNEDQFGSSVGGKLKSD